MTVRKVIRSTTGDRGPPDGGVVIHTVEQLGPNMSLLPNGSLLCRNVPLARTGWMMYGPGETPIKCAAGTDVAYVQRTEQTLFDPDCLASFVGASIVDEHPSDDVTPANWRQLAKGTVLTARRGDGDDKDLVIGDVLITDAGLIASIQSGKREVSAGYDADYEQISDGIGQQTNIIVNHIALVERGRCGPRCAIGDHEYQPPKKGQPSMATKRVQIKTGSPRRVTLDALRQKVADAEEALMAAEEDQGGEMEEQDGDTHIHIHTGSSPSDETKDDGTTPAESGGGDLDARITAIEQSIQQLTESVAQLVAGEQGETKDDDLGDGDPEEDPDSGDVDDESKVTADEGNPFANKDDEDTKGKTMDSAALETGYAALLAKAEVLVPGFRMPTFDAKAPRKKTVDSMCALRRKVVDAAYMTKDGASLINGITGSKALNIGKMGCADVATLFNAAAGAKAAINNATATRDSATKQATTTTVVNSIAAINKANAEFWAKQAVR